MSAPEPFASVEFSPMIVRLDGEARTLEGMEVERIESSATISEIPGNRLAMTLVRGRVVAVLRCGQAPTPLLVGRVGGEVIALSGLEVVGPAPRVAPSDLPPAFDVAKCLERAKTDTQRGGQFG